MSKTKPEQVSFETGELIAYDALFGGHKIFGKVARPDVDGVIVYLNDGKEEQMMNRGMLLYRLNAHRIDVDDLLQEANSFAAENFCLK